MALAGRDATQYWVHPKRSQTVGVPHLVYDAERGCRRGADRGAARASSCTTAGRRADGTRRSDRRCQRRYQDRGKHAEPDAPIHRVLPFVGTSCASLQMWAQKVLLAGRADRSLGALRAMMRDRTLACGEWGNWQPGRLWLFKFWFESRLPSRRPTVAEGIPTVVWPDADEPASGRLRLQSCP